MKNRVRGGWTRSCDIRSLVPSRVSNGLPCFLGPWSLMVSPGLQWSPLVPLVSNGLPWSPMVSPGLQWSPLVSNGLPWSPVVSSGLPWSRPDRIKRITSGMSVASMLE